MFSYIQHLFTKKYLKTYAQCGEDIISKYALSTFNIHKPYYIDIGAHDPFLLSNTALFYEAGARGICIEPDPSLFKTIKKIRNRDICLQCGVVGGILGSDAQRSMKLYLMSTPTLNTFSREEAERVHATTSYKIVSTMDVPIFSINEIVEKFAVRRPQFISLDVEGFDLSILETFDFLRFGPEVFCIETLEFTENTKPKKRRDILELMVARGYTIYADTFINTIFINEDASSC